MPLVQKNVKKYTYQNYLNWLEDVVFQEREYTEKYILEDNKYGSTEIFNGDEKMKLKTFDIEINLWEVFEKELEEREKPNLLKEK